MNFAILTRMYLSKTYSTIFSFLDSIIRKLFLLGEFFLLIRLVLKFFSASSKAAVVDLIYQYSDVLVSPFRFIFSDVYWPRGYFIEVATLSAMIGYMLAIFLILQILRFFYRENN